MTGTSKLRYIAFQLHRLSVACYQALQQVPLSGHFPSDSPCTSSAVEESRPAQPNLIRPPWLLHSRPSPSSRVARLRRWPPQKTAALRHCPRFCCAPGLALLATPSRLCSFRAKTAGFHPRLRLLQGSTHLRRVSVGSPPRLVLYRTSVSFDIIQFFYHVLQPQCASC